MKITNVTSIIVAVPVKPVHPTSVVVVGEQPFLGVIVKIQTDAGITGIGEAPVVTGAEFCKSMVDSAKPLLAGQDPQDVDLIRRKLYSKFNLIHFHLHAANWAISGIEMGLWDILAKSCKLPLYRLWGTGRVDSVKFWGWVPHTTLSQIKAEAKRYVKEGFDTIYEKVGIDQKHDVASVQAMREAGGDDVDIRIDANQAWTTATAIRLIRKMERYDLEFVEQPVTMYNLNALARVRNAVSTPILAHESSWTFYDALNVIKHDAADAIQLDPRFDAGLHGFRLAAGMAEAAGMGAVVHSYGELGVATAYLLHATASCPAFTYANQTAYYFLSDDIVKGGMMKFKNGRLDVPQKPGLGIELDQSKITKYSKLYQAKVKGREFSPRWQSPRKLLGLTEEKSEYVPRAGRI